MARCHQLGGILLLLLGFTIFSTAGFAQEKQELRDDKSASLTSLTGAVRGSDVTADQTGKPGGLGNPILGGNHRPLYRLQPSDVIEISFTVSPEFNQTLTVQPDGYVALRDVRPIRAEGLTVEDFRQGVDAAYRGYLHDPDVAVALKEFEHPHFTVGGEIGRPGKYDLHGDTTVAEAVEIAGGFTPQAKHSQVVLFRRVNDELVETRVIDLKKMLKKNGLREDAHLQEGDFIFVPRNAISKIAQFLTRPSMSMYVSSSQF